MNRLLRWLRCFQLWSGCARAICTRRGRRSRKCFKQLCLIITTSEEFSQVILCGIAPPASAGNGACEHFALATSL
eukprot:symbB.v1.2.029940.t2/scaffold3324.1/size59041/8